MIKTHTLSDAQAAVLSGPVDFNANGTMAVTSGRENTLASLRRAGFLAGNLLTIWGTNARATLANGSRKVNADADNPRVPSVPENVAGAIMRNRETAAPAPFTAADLSDDARTELAAGTVDEARNAHPTIMDELYRFGMITKRKYRANCGNGHWLTPTGEAARTAILATLTRTCREGHDVAPDVDLFRNGTCRPCVDAAHARNAAEYAERLAGWKREAAAKKEQENAAMRAASERIMTDPTHPLYAAAHAYPDSVVTDAELDRKAASTGAGDRAEADILRPLTPRVRRMVVSEAMAHNNTTPGAIWSGSLYEARRSVLAGATPSGDLADRLLAFDPTGEKAGQAKSWDAFKSDALKSVPVKPSAAPTGCTCAAYYLASAIHENGCLLSVPVETSDAPADDVRHDPSFIIEYARADYVAPADDADAFDPYAGGVEDAPGAPVSVPDDLPLTLSLTRAENGRVVARVGAYERTFRDGPAVRLHAAMWAHGKGFRPVKGRAFKWQRSGKLVSAPAALI